MAPTWQRSPLVSGVPNDGYVGAASTLLMERIDRALALYLGD